MTKAGSTTRRRIAVITGTRAEYGLLTSTLRALRANARADLQLVVTGMHLLRPFGHTIDDIVADGWEVAARVPMQTGRDDPLDGARGLARGVRGIAEFLERARTDVVLVLGDRIEALAGALAATTTGRVLAHVHGGDVAPGDFDDATRHAITKLAHLHFPATRAAAQRIVRLGEQPWRVHAVGAPGLDRIRELLRCTERVPCVSKCSHNPVCAPDRSERHALVVFHATGRPPDIERRAMASLLETVAGLGLNRVVLYPNSDRGHSGVVAAIEAHARTSPPGTVTVFRSLRRDQYLRALIAADVLVGNSSSGIIEAPYAGTPAVDVGDRQRGRQAGTKTVVHVATEVPAKIRAAVARALRQRLRRGGRTAYGAGVAGPEIARFLVETGLDQRLRRKVIRY